MFRMRFIVRLARRVVLLIVVVGIRRFPWVSSSSSSLPSHPCDYYRSHHPRRQQLLEPRHLEGATSPSAVATSLFVDVGHGSHLFRVTGHGGAGGELRASDSTFVHGSAGWASAIGMECGRGHQLHLRPTPHRRRRWRQRAPDCIDAGARFTVLRVPSEFRIRSFAEFRVSGRCTSFHIPRSVPLLLHQ